MLTSLRDFVRLLRQERLFTGATDHENRIINCGRLGFPHYPRISPVCLRACAQESKQTAGFDEADEIHFRAILRNYGASSS